MILQKARISAMKNQLLVLLDSRLDDIERLAENLPTDTPDEALIAMVMNFVGGMLFDRRDDADNLESD